MADYGRQVEFGCFPTPEVGRLDELLGMADVADRLGLDFVGIQDHPYHRRHLDMWTLLSTLAARTDRVRFLPDVACLPLRPPAVLGKSAATLDLLTGGRVEMGLGAGGFWDAITAMGPSRLSPGASVDALEEAIGVMRLMWSDERSVTYDGSHYRLAGLHPGPRPAHDISIWLGAFSPRTLAMTGRLADGWLPSSPYAPPEKLPDMQARIDDAAAAAGRDPTSVRRAYNINGTITGTTSEGFLQGPVDQWIEELTGLVVDEGMDTFLFWPQETGEEAEEQVRRFAEEVVPATREAVGSERGHL